MVGGSTVFLMTYLQSSHRRTKQVKCGWPISKSRAGENIRFMDNKTLSTKDKAARPNRVNVNNRPVLDSARASNINQIELYAPI